MGMKRTKKQPVIEEHEKAILALDQQILGNKVGIADRLVEIRRLEDSLASLQEKYVDAVFTYGRALGIDLDSKSQHWHFDTRTMQFTRTE